jgi:hypothetical protein
MLKALTVAALLVMPATAFAHGGGGHGGGFGGGHFGGAHVGAFHSVGFHNGFHDGRFGHARFFFGPGFGYDGGSSCWAWTPAGWQWVCGY